MKPDSELEMWQREWQAHNLIPANLKEKVERDNRDMKRFWTWGIVASAILGGGLLYLALVSRNEEVVAAATAACLLLAIAWVLELIFARTVWKPSAENTRAYLEVSIRRSRGALRALIPQAVLYVIGWTINIGWLFRVRPQNMSELWAFITSWPALLLWLATAALAVVAVRYARKTQRELQNLIALRQQLDES